MKIALTKDEQGVVTGYTMERESDDELSVIETIRDMYFWHDTKYDGRQSDGKGDYSLPNADNTKVLKWKLVK